MTQRINNIIVFIAVVFSSFLILVWHFYFDTGTLALYGDKNFEVYLRGYKKFFCIKNPCIIKLKSGKYSAIISKKGFKNLSTIILIRRRTKNEYKVDLKIIPKISQINTIPYTLIKNLHKSPVKKEKIIDGKWNVKNTKFFYISKKNQTLFMQTNGNNIKISKFFGLFRPMIFVSPNSLYLLIKDEDSLFLVNVLKKLKHQIINGVRSQNVLWNPSSSYFVFNDEEENIYLYSLIDKKYDLILKNINGNLIVWISNNNILYFKENSFYIYDIEQNKNFFSVSVDNIIPNSLILEETGKKVYFESNNKNYELILEK